MGTMIRRLIPQRMNAVRPHTKLFVVAVMCLCAAILFPSMYVYAGYAGIVACIYYATKVGANCSKVVSFLERMNTAALLILLIKVIL